MILALLTYPQHIATKRALKQQQILNEFHWFHDKLNGVFVELNQFFIRHDRLSAQCNKNVLLSLRKGHFQIANVAEFGIRLASGELACTSWQKLSPPVSVVLPLPDKEQKLRFFGPVHSSFIGEAALIVAKSRSDGSEINALLPQSIIKKLLIELQRSFDFSAVVDATAGVPLSIEGRYTMPLDATIFPLFEQVLIDSKQFDDGQMRYLAAKPIEALPGLALVVAIDSDKLYSGTYWPDKLLLLLYITVFIGVLFLWKAYERAYESREAKLSKAIDAGEFFNHYQPIYDCKSDNLVGIEVLVRWLHPIEGVLYPDRFITDIEGNGLNVKLSTAVVESLIDDVMKAPALFNQLKVNINISGEHLKDKKFLTQVFEARKFIANLVLEITETELVDVDNHQVNNAITLIREQGILLAIDDFGTGYAGLQYLQQLPLDIIKIDRSFISAIGSESPRAKMLDAVIQMAHQMDLAIVAEGVETKEQADYLISKDVYQHQGWLYSKAISINELFKLMN